MPAGHEQQASRAVGHLSGMFPLLGHEFDAANIARGTLASATPSLHERTSPQETSFRGMTSIFRQPQGETFSCGWAFYPRDAAVESVDIVLLIKQHGSRALHVSCSELTFPIAHNFPNVDEWMFSIFLTTPGLWNPKESPRNRSSVSCLKVGIG